MSESQPPHQPVEQALGLHNTTPYDSKLVYAGFWKRALAIAIDFVIILVVMYPVGVGLGLAIEPIVSEMDDVDSLIDFLGPLLALPLLFEIAVGWLYFALMECSKYQGTLGKLALGIKVTDYQGAPISCARATVRLLAKGVSSILGVGFLVAAFTKKKQAFHDTFAECLVVVRGKVSETIGQEAYSSTKIKMKWLQIIIIIIVWLFIYVSRWARDYYETKLMITMAELEAKGYWDDSLNYHRYDQDSIARPPAPSPSPSPTSSPTPSPSPALPGRDYTEDLGFIGQIENEEVMELYRVGKYDRAVVVAKKALEVAEKNVGPNHPDVATDLNNLAVLYDTQGHYTQADVALSLNNLAALYRATERDEEAKTLEKRAARIRAIQR